MKTQLDHELLQQIDQCVELLTRVLGADLLGVYLYGSAIVGGLQRFSDVDVFVVSERRTSREEKVALVTELLSISGVYMKSSRRSVEMTIVVKSEVNPWRYPPTFDFQYGDWLRTDFESGIIEPWASKEMPDLALLITQVLLASETVFGQEPARLLDPVPYRDFIAATGKELRGLMAELEHDIRNILLTLARAWCTLETDTIRSKPGAADWAINRLPAEHRTVMERARAICLGEEEEYWDDLSDRIRPCAEYIVAQIDDQISRLEIDRTTSRSITLAR